MGKRWIKLVSLILGCLVGIFVIGLGTLYSEEIKTVTIKAWAPNGGSPLRLVFLKQRGV